MGQQLQTFYWARLILVQRKACETGPKKISDNPLYLNFPGRDNHVPYSEHIYREFYRYYDKKWMCFSHSGMDYHYTIYYETIKSKTTYSCRKKSSRWFFKPVYGVSFDIKTWEK